MNKNSKQNQPRNNGDKFPNPILTFVLTAIVFWAIMGVVNPNEKNTTTESVYVSFTEFEEVVKDNVENEKIVVREDNEGKVTAIIGEEEDAKTYTTQVNPKVSSVKKIIDTYDIEYKFEYPINYLGIILNIVFYGFFIAIFWFMFLPMLKSKNMSSSSSKKKSNIPKTTFDDIGGLSEEAKNEILQVQSLLKKPEEAKKLGLRPSKGVLLYGPSGTGKTLVAKALAHSFNAEFISAEGSSFVEMFAGMGAKRVRELFQKAQKNKPAVIFIDEIDAVGKKRSANGNFSNDEREQTLNQLLVSMDGIETNEDVFIVAATNRLDVLDEALLRPGRFDYKIMVDLPDVEGRKEIIKIHTKNKPLDADVVERIEEIAHSTAGYSGADIESLFNKAGYNAFSQNRNTINMEDVNFGIDRIIIGNAGRKINNMETKKRVAYHEAGHAAISSLLNPGSIRKATIIPRGQALGFVAHVPKEGLMDEDELTNHLKVMVAGGVAERIIFEKHSMGVSDDFKKAKELIEKMIQDWGMGDAPLIPSFSDKEKHEQMKQMYQNVVYETKTLLEKNYSFFDNIAQLLLEKETIDGAEIEELKKNLLLKITEE